MQTYGVPRARRWLAALIVTLVFIAVAGAAGVGWWYARESAPHQGPIILISVDGIVPADLPAYGGQRSDMPAIDTLAADAVIFERAYTHSPQILPAHASILSGQLPFEHQVRDDAGFALSGDTRTLPELLRNRGFATGAAVSTFLLRRESGIAQGFTFFDGEMPAPASPGTASIERDGTLSMDAVEPWVEQQSSQRFFLFIQVDGPHADPVVTRLTQILKDRDLYDTATIVFVGDRGDAGTGMSLDEPALRVPLLVKQPGAAGAGRRVSAAVQHVDLLPTLLDLVRAPIPDRLAGQSLRAILEGDDLQLPDRPIFAESLAAYFRFGGDPVFAVTQGAFRYVRGASEELLAVARTDDDAGGGEAGELARLRAVLDGILGPSMIERTSRLGAADEERLALLGSLVNLRLPSPGDLDLDAATQRTLVAAHRDAAVLIGQKNYSAGIRALQSIVRQHATLASVHYQIGALLGRTGRLEEGIAAFRRAQELQPNVADISIALADALLRTRQIASAQEEADRAVMQAGIDEDARIRAAAHEMAARLALARQDAETAIRHAEMAHAADPTVPVPDFVRGRLLYDEGKYDEAAATFEKAAAALRASGAALADLHLYYAESLARLDRYGEAETEFREELRAFPRNIQAYTSLAMLYRASNREAAVEDVLNELVATTPTPEGYAVAAQLWTIVGDRSRAEALRSDARARFRGDPSVALLGRDGRR